MQVQLIVANEQHNGRAVPINVPSFMIGRAEGCNLRSRSKNVSRYHCVISTENETVTIQDLGGENGTFVNGNRVSGTQPLKDGDKLVVGAHSFVVSIKAGAAKPATDQGGAFELTPTPTEQNPEKGDTTSAVDPNMATVAINPTKKPPEPEAEIMFELRVEGQRVSVSKSKLFELARKGKVSPDDLIMVAGTKVFADSIQGIVFGDQASSVVTSPTGAPVQSSAATAAPSAPEADPFGLPNLDGIAEEASPFNVTSEPFVRVARKESAFKALWNALDISFSRVYTMEGNNLVIHSVKALYYILVVIAFLAFLFMVIEFCKDLHESGDFLQELSKYFVGLAATIFGGVTIIVIVRVLLEMLLLAWIESAKEEQKEKEEQ